MKDSILMTSMDYLDDRYIAEADPTVPIPLKGLRRRLAVKWASAAAGFCAAVLLVWNVVLPLVQVAEPFVPPVPPVYDNATYTAAEIGSFFSGTYDGGTSSYTKIYVPAAEYLNVSSVPSEAYIPIYTSQDVSKDLDAAELTAFTDGILARLAEAVGEEVPSYSVERDNSPYLGDFLNVSFGERVTKAMGEYGLTVRQTSDHHLIALRSTSSLGKITLDGTPIQVDQSMSDGEIIASLGKIREKIFTVYGVTFTDTAIVRSYGSYSEYGAERLYVYFYNESDHPLNAVYGTPVSDYIRLSFDNFSNWKGDVVSNTVLSNVNIDYRKLRSNVQEMYTVSKQVSMISLEEAEALLYNGYVFGGHSCPLCMAAQDKVDFTDYDFVGLTYIRGEADGGERVEFVPFYAFYKQIGTSENGNLTYALTYVPAVEVEGYEAYFESQTQNHRSSSYGVEAVE